MNAIKNLTVDLIIAYSRAIVFEEFEPVPDEIDSSVKIYLHNFPTMRQCDVYLAVAGFRFFTVTEKYILLFNKL